MEYVVRLQPATVLDVGPGYGKWGLLIREALDFMHGRHEPSQFLTRIDALEVFEGYRSPIYDWIYNDIRYGDIVRLAPELPAYDLVIMGDVIEHMTKHDGRSVLQSLLAKCKNVVIATPSIFFNQEALDNPWEQHLSLWTLEDFREWPYDYQRVGITNIAVLAGRGASWPTHRDAMVNDIAHRIPLLRGGAIRPGLVKAIARRLQARQVR